MRSKWPVAWRDRHGRLEQRSEILPDIELRILAADQHRDLTSAPGRCSRIDFRCACLQDVARGGLILVWFREYGGGGGRLNVILRRLLFLIIWLSLRGIF